MAPPKNNQNAVGHASPKRGKTGASTMMSMPYESWEAFKSACDLSEGRVIDNDEEYRKLWRFLCSSAVQLFIEGRQSLDSTFASK